MKILLIQLSDAGDLLQSTLLLRCLKKQIHNAELHLLVREEHAEVIATNPYIDQLHRFEDRQKTWQELLPQDFDEVIDLQPTAESALFLNEWQPPRPTGQQKGFKIFLASLWRSKPAPQPKAEAYLKQLAHLNITNDGGGLDVRIPQSAEVPFSDIPASHHAGFVAIALEASPLFQWPLPLLQQICSELQHPLVLLGSTAATPLAEKVRGIDATKIYTACGKFSPFETADLVRKSKLLIAFQPYYIQLAAAFSKELVMLATSGKDEAPYYSAYFLKNRISPPFDRLLIPKGIQQKAHLIPAHKKSDLALQKWATQITAAATQRLRSKA